MAESTRVQPTFDAPLMQMPPVRAPSPAVPAPSASAQAASVQRVFAADGAGDEAAGAPSPEIARLAELVAHRGAEGPLTIGIIGGAGCGKSRALAQVVAHAKALSRGAGAISPYLGALTVAVMEAGDLGGDPTAALAERVHGALARSAPEIATAAADEAAHSAGDPHARLRSIGETLDGTRRRLDAERRARDEAESRRARLIETILYESGGSRVDAYARANRAGIESALASFGFTRDEPIETYKGLVRTLTETGGPAARIAASLKSLWAYKGQGKLLVWAVILLVIAWAFGRFGQDLSWLDGAQSAGDAVRSFADKVRAHQDWFGLARLACLVGAVLCILACVLRAVRFSRPLLRGAELVDADLGARRGELDNLVAHHTQRVDGLAAEADTLARRAQDAERRAGGAQAATPALLMPEAPVAADRARRAYLDSVAALLTKDGSRTGRLVVALDDLDRLPPAQALGVLESTAAALRARGFALVAALDTARLVRALGETARVSLERVIQIPFRVDAVADGAWDDVVAGLAASRTSAPAPAVDATRSALDRPLDADERSVLASLAPLAGPAPRGVTRLVNLYRLGRDAAADHWAAFAFALALAIGGTPEEKAAFDAAVRTDAGAGSPARTGARRVQAALETVGRLSGQPLTADEARRATVLAERWTLEA